MMETEARLRASLPPAVVATVRLEYVDDDLLVARCGGACTIELLWDGEAAHQLASVRHLRFAAP